MLLYQGAQPALILKIRKLKRHQFTSLSRVTNQEKTQASFLHIFTSLC